MMADDRLAEIRARLAAVRPGARMFPVSPDGEFLAHSYDDIRYLLALLDEQDAELRRLYGEDMSALIERARTFLINSRNEVANELIRALVAEIQRLDSELARLRAERDEAMESRGGE